MKLVHKTKIIATLGPAITQKLFTIKDFSDVKNASKKSLAYELMQKAIEAGMNVARFNFSHGDHEEHLIRLKILRDVSEKLNVNISTMLDTKGPEIRVINIKSESGLKLEKGDKVEIFSIDKTRGEGRKFSVTDSTGTYNMAKDAKVGGRVLVDDGKLSLLVTGVDAARGVISVTAENEHVIKNNKRINLPDCDYSMPFFSQKDQDDILFAIKEKFDYIALSFCNSAKDLKIVRDFITKNTSRTIKLIAKIETMTAIKNIDDIINDSDGIMVARGDLGIEIPYAQVPHWEKIMIRKCRMMGKPVIVATQMLDSLERGLQPTRAEVTDVFFAVENGADATMLSGETAQGSYPINAISVMSNILETSERTFNHHRALNSTYATSALAKTKDGKTAMIVAKELVVEEQEKDIQIRKSASYLVVFSGSPDFIRALSSTRMHKNIIAISDKASMSTSFGISYGVMSRLVDNIDLSKVEREKIVARIKAEFPKNTEFSILYPETIKQVGG